MPCNIDSNKSDLLYLNIQGLKDKVNILEEVLVSSKCKYLCLSEHWLKLMSLSLFTMFLRVSW